MREPDPAARRFQIEGHDLGYPTEFRDGSSLAALFVVNARVANRRIAESGLRVAEIAPGRAILALTGVHYTDTDCGAYEETAQAFFIRKPGERGRLPYLSTWSDLVRGQVASFTWKLQVTSRLSQYAGQRMWGFPKTLDDIRFERSGGRARMTLRMAGRDVFDFSLRDAGSQSPAPVTSAVYSIHEGAQHVSDLTQRYRETGYQPFAGEIVLGDHPLADELRELGLPRRPLLSTWNGHLEFSMSAPRKL